MSVLRDGWYGGSEKRTGAKESNSFRHTSCFLKKPLFDPLSQIFCIQNITLRLLTWFSSIIEIASKMNTLG